jgi:hypothetical protein
MHVSAEREEAYDEQRAAQDVGPSKSGKTILIATTEGNAPAQAATSRSD